MDLCYLLVSCALFTSVLALPYEPFRLNKNVSLAKIVKRSAPKPVVYCSYPGDIANGRVIISTLNEKRRPFDGSREEYPEGTRLQYSCLNGYVLESPNSLTCTKTSKWSAPPPKCIRAQRLLAYCPYPGDIANGRVNISTLNEKRRPFDESEEEYPEGSRLQYFCVYGYTLDGASSLTCTNTSKWSAAPPTCITDVRPEIGYCENPGLVLNGRAEYIPPAKGQEEDTMSDEYPEQSELKFSCDEGYRLQGHRSVTCQSKGVWSGDIPSCVSVLPLTYCQYPGDIINGQVVHVPKVNERMRPYDEIEDEYPEGSQLQYSCDDGYTLEGPARVTCRNTGRWSSRSPTCKRAEIPLTYCQYPGNINNGRVVPKVNGRTRPYDEIKDEYPEGTQLQYSCDDGYTLEGSSTVTCRSTGRWSSRSPTCKRAGIPLTYCQYPGEINNGRVVPKVNGRTRPYDEIKDEYPEGTQLQYSCDDGYILEGSSTVTCRSTGRWSSRSPTCKRAEIPPTYCQYPGDIINGRVNHVPKGNERRRPYDKIKDEYPEGSQLQYSCDDGYTLEGSPRVVCRNTGRWSSRNPTCKRAETPLTYCQYPGEINNGRMVPKLNGRTRPYDEIKDKYPEGTRLQYSCDDGYFLEGSSTVTCRSTGRWSSRSPTCIRDVDTEIQYCENPGLVLNGRAEYTPPPKGQGEDPMSDEYPEQSVLKFSCDEGYRLQGHRSVTCQSTGVWSGDMPSCVPG